MHAFNEPDPPVEIETLDTPKLLILSRSCEELGFRGCLMVLAIEWQA